MYIIFRAGHTYHVLQVDTLYISEALQSKSSGENRPTRRLLFNSPLTQGLELSCFLSTLVKRIATDKQRAYSN